MNNDVATKEIQKYFKKLGQLKGLKATQRGMRKASPKLKSELDRNLTGRVLNVRTGRLRDDAGQSIGRPNIVGQKVIQKYGSNVEYARIHELGGVIKPVNAEYLTFQIDGQWIRTKEVNIPKREPFGKAMNQSAGRYLSLIGLELVEEAKKL